MTAKSAPVAMAFAIAAALLIGADRGGVMILYDFGRGDKAWPSINDGVMGGVSSGRMVVAEGVASFQGVVSRENNGGFASVRSRPLVRDLSEFDGIAVRVRGDGKHYSLRLRSDAAFDGVSYQAVIDPPPNKWTDVFVPFTQFDPVFRGRKLPEHPPIDQTRITTVGFLISRQEGPFHVDISTIAAYTEAGDPANAVNGPRPRLD